jgi:hypothetical protein
MYAPWKGRQVQCVLCRRYVGSRQFPGAVLGSLSLRRDRVPTWMLAKTPPPPPELLVLRRPGTWLCAEPPLLRPRALSGCTAAAAGGLANASQARAVTSSADTAAGPLAAGQANRSGRVLRSVPPLGPAPAWRRSRGGCGVAFGGPAWRRKADNGGRVSCLIGVAPQLFRDTRTRHGAAVKQRDGKRAAGAYRVLYGGSARAEGREETTALFARAPRGRGAMRSGA